MFSVALFSEDPLVCRDLREGLEWYHRLLERPLFRLTISRDKKQWTRVRKPAGVDLIFFEVSDREELETLRRIREDDVEAVIIYDGSVSPEEMVVPDIRPLSLMRKPFGEGTVRHVMGDLCLYLMREKDRDCFSHRFICQDKTRRLVVPYSSIYYFETRNKRIVMVTSGGEYEFYDTFSRMEAGLPEGFVRCHRSYIVNLAYLTGVDFAHFQMELDHRINIPISKKYRNQVEKVYN